MSTSEELEETIKNLQRALVDVDLSNFNTKTSSSDSFKSKIAKELRLLHGVDVRSALLGVMATVLSYMVVQYGVIPALSRYYVWKSSRPSANGVISTIQQLINRLPQKTKNAIPSLTSDMSIIVRVINDKGHPQPIMDDENDDIPLRLQEVWEIIGNTIANTEKELSPIVLPHSKGAISFVTIDIPPPQYNVDLTTDLIRELRTAHFIPLHPPKRGNLVSIKFLSFDTSIVNGKVHPELVLTVVF
jgi:hypothetical protein